MARTKGAVRRTMKKTTEVKKSADRAPHRWRPGTVALREIRRFQKSTDLLIMAAPMQRIISGILRANHNGMRIQAKALPVLMEAVQALQVKLFEESQLACIHAKRQMITIADLRYACHNMQLECPTKEERIHNYKQSQAKLRAADLAKSKLEAKRAAETAEAADNETSDTTEENDYYVPDAKETTQQTA